MVDEVYFDGDPAVDSRRRHLEQVLQGKPRRRRWPWMLAVASGGAWTAWRLMRPVSDESPSSSAAAPHRVHPRDTDATNPQHLAIVLKRFETPDEIRHMQKGVFELVHIGGMTVGRATYQPGWKWSEHVGPSRGQRLCGVAHIGLVLAGTATAAFEDGTVWELNAGSLFYIPARPHDSWVVGDQPYVSLHFLGADQYAK